MGSSFDEAVAKGSFFGGELSVDMFGACWGSNISDVRFINLENADLVEGSLLTGTRGGLVDDRVVNPSNALIRFEMPLPTVDFVAS